MKAQPGEMTVVMGISALFLDAGVALLVDGEPASTQSEARFSSRPRDPRFPFQAIEFALAEAGLEARDVDYVGVATKQLARLDRLIETDLVHAPRGFRTFLDATPLCMSQVMRLPRDVGRALPGRAGQRTAFVPRHEALAAASFFSSAFEDAAILVFDEVGEWVCSALGVGRGERVRLEYERRFPHSLGLLCKAFGYYCGATGLHGEPGLTSLRGAGEPRHRERIARDLLDLKEDGSFRVDLRHFDTRRGVLDPTPAFDAFFGQARRRPASGMSAHYLDVAASFLTVAEEIVLRSARHLHEISGLRNLCLAGDVVKDCMDERRLLEDTPFEEVHSTGAGLHAATGTARLIWHQLLGNPRGLLQPAPPSRRVESPVPGEPLRGETA